MEKEIFSPHPTGVAVGLTAGVVYVVCAAAVTLWPAKTVSFFANWFHGIDLNSIAVSAELTIGGFFIGLGEVVLAFYLVGLIFGWFYHLCYWHCKKRKWI